MTLQKKLALVTVLPLVIIFVLIVFLTEKMVTDSLEEDAHTVAKGLAETGVANLQTSVTELRTILDELASSMAALDYKHHESINRELLLDMFENSLANHAIFGGSLYLAENAVDDGGAETEYYIYTDESGKYVRTTLADTKTNAPWYQGAFVDRKETLTEPYVFNIRTLDYVANPSNDDLRAPGNVFMLTMAVPIIGHNGKTLGVITLDIRAERFDNLVKDLKPFGTGYAVLATNKGVIIGSPSDKAHNTNYGELTFIKGMDPKNVIKAYAAGESYSDNFIDTRYNEQVYMVTLPMSIGELPPMGVVVNYNIKSATNAIGLPTMQWVSRGILGAIIFIIILTMVIIRRSIIRYLMQFMNALKDLTEGDGDLTKTISIKTGDEFEVLAGYLNKFVSNLRSIMVDVKNSSEEVASGNNQLAATMEELSTTFENQSQQVSEVASGMDAISSVSNGIVQSLGENVSKMEEAKDSMHNGSSQLKVAVENMNDIKDKNISLSETVEHLAESSKMIGEILRVINDIADQTNLLALNAAIEAARAGDAGRGFAVVADEVRKLAERTQSSTGEISGIVTTLQKETELASSGMDSATASVNTGLESVMKTDAVFKQVVDVVNEISATTKEISESINDQFSMVQSANDNTQAIASGIEESVHAVEEVGSTVNHLQNKAESLKMIVSKFKVS